MIKRTATANTAAGGLSPARLKNDDPAIWTLRRLRLADGTEFSAATREARAKETEAEKRERLKAERREMAEALRRHRASTSKGGRNDGGC